MQEINLPGLQRHRQGQRPGGALHGLPRPTPGSVGGTAQPGKRPAPSLPARAVTLLSASQAEDPPG